MSSSGAPASPTRLAGTGRARARTRRHQLHRLLHVTFSRRPAAPAGVPVHHVCHPRHSALRTLLNAVQSLLLLAWKRPWLVVSTGADVAVPVFVLARLLGARHGVHRDWRCERRRRWPGASATRSRPVHRPVAGETGRPFPRGARARRPAVILVASAPSSTASTRSWKPPIRPPPPSWASRLRPDRPLAGDPERHWPGSASCRRTRWPTPCRHPAGDLPRWDRPPGRGDASRQADRGDAAPRPADGRQPSRGPAGAAAAPRGTPPDSASASTQPS